MSQSAKTLYEFGAFRLDPEERVLWRGEELIVLPPKVFDTLRMLVSREGSVVTKSELMEAIWADAFVEESNLSQNIYTLRRTLGVDEQGRQFIETVPRRGYRFAAPVKSSAAAANDGPTQAEVVLNGVTATVSAESLATHAALLDSRTEDSRAITSMQGPASTSAQVHQHSALRYSLWAAFGAVVLCALGLGIYQFLIRRGELSDSKIAPIEQIRFQRLTDSGDVDSPTISPSGELLAYVRFEEEGESVWVEQIATGSSFQTLPPSRKGYRSLAFSPDGKYLFFRDGPDPGMIYQTFPYGGAPRTVADNVWSDFSVSTDGKQVAFIRRDTGRNSRFLTLANVDGSGERELITKETRLSSASNAPAWSPDGSRIVVGTGGGKLLEVTIATGEETELKTPIWRAIFNNVWMPNGNHLIVSAREGNEPVSQLWMISYPDAEVRRLTNDLESYLWLSVSADGRVVTRKRRIISHLWLHGDSDVKKARQLTFSEFTLDGRAGLTWTLNRKIIFSSFVDNVTDLYTMNPDGSNRVQLTANAGKDNVQPVVSNDGRYVVFTSNRSGVRQIWRMDIDGRNQKQLTFGESQREQSQYPALSPDSTQVFFIRYGAGPAAIWKVSIDGGAAVPVSHLTDASTEGALSISPDGKWFAYQHASAQPEVRSEERTLRIGVLPTDGNGVPKLFDLPMRRSIVQWSADSTTFYYAGGTFNSSSLWRQPINGGRPQKLLDFPDRIFNFAWSRDNKRLVISGGKEQGDAISITNLP